MNLLVSVKEFRTRFGLRDVEEINVNAAAAISASTIQLESILRTEFSRTVRQDRYWVDKDEFPFTGDFISIRLVSGLVDLSETYEIRVASQLDDFATESPIELKYVETNAEKGRVIITGTNSLRPVFRPFFLDDKMFLQVDYTSGLLTTDESYGRVYTGVPEWLKELGLNAAYKTYKLALGCKEKELTSYGTIISSIIESHVRFYPSSLGPLV